MPGANTGHEFRSAGIDRNAAGARRGFATIRRPASGWARSPGAVQVRADRRADLLDDLPVDQHNALLRSVALQVADVVPTAERRRPVYAELVERVTA